MADTPIAVTPASVAGGTVPQTVTGTFGETVTAGQLVYRKTSDGKFYKADADATAVGANVEIDNVYGVAVTGGASGESGTIQRTGDYTCGGTVVPGTVYALSATAGGFTAIGNLVATDYVTVLGIAISTTQIHLLIYPSNVQVPA